MLIRQAGNMIQYYKTPKRTFHVLSETKIKEEYKEIAQHFNEHPGSIIGVINKENLNKYQIIGKKDGYYIICLTTHKTNLSAINDIFGDTSNIDKNYNIHNLKYKTKDNFEIIQIFLAIPKETLKDILYSLDATNSINQENKILENCNNLIKINQTIPIKFFLPNHGFTNIKKVNTWEIKVFDKTSSVYHDIYLHTGKLFNQSDNTWVSAMIIYNNKKEYYGHLVKSIDNNFYILTLETNLDGTSSYNSIKWIGNIKNKYQIIEYNKDNTVNFVENKNSQVLIPNNEMFWDPITNSFKIKQLLIKQEQININLNKYNPKLNEVLSSEICVQKNNLSDVIN